LTGFGGERKKELGRPSALTVFEKGLNQKLKPIPFPSARKGDYI